MGSGKQLLLAAAVLRILVGSLCEEQQVVVSIDVVNPVGETDENFVCATLDWWPPEKCDYGTCSWGRSSLLNLDLKNVKFQKAVKGLSPILLRLGGSLQDQIIYQIGKNPGPCLPLEKRSSAMFGFTGGCLNMTRWQALNAFFKATGASVAFGLNALYGREKSQGPWNSKNARDLIQYSAEHGYDIVAWELGNELCGSGVGTSIGAKQYAADVKQLRSIVDTVYAKSAKRPLVVAPGGFFEERWFREFFQDSGPKVLDASSHHIYNLGPGVDAHLVEKILDPTYASRTMSTTFQSLQTLVRTVAPWSQAWVGEAGGAYNSGHHNVTDRFVFSFWYLDQLGMAALYNTTVYCRQTLIGGNYGLVSSSFDLNPDYFSALLWKKLMGNKVFASSSPATHLRTYAHCLKHVKGGLAALFINFSNSTKYVVDVSLVSRSCTCKTHGPRSEYQLKPLNNDIYSETMLLNGQPLRTAEDGSIPVLHPTQVSPDEPIIVDPQSILFATFPNAGIAACYQTA